MSTAMAKGVTFLFSAALHELCLALIFRKIQFHMTCKNLFLMLHRVNASFCIVLMLLQVPLNWIEKRFWKGTNFGNCIFWT